MGLGTSIIPGASPGASPGLLVGLQAPAAHGAGQAACTGEAPGAPLGPGGSGPLLLALQGGEGGVLPMFFIELHLH